MNEDTNRLTRRESLAKLGGLAVTAFGAGVTPQTAGKRFLRDIVYRNGGRRSLLALRRSGAGYIGEITMGVSR